MDDGLPERRRRLEIKRLVYAISYWPELPTCIGVRLEPDGKTLGFTAPWGIEHNFLLDVKPNLHVGLAPEVYQKRIADKRWGTIWPKLRIS